MNVFERIPIGTAVKVVKATDETCDTSFIGVIGEVIDLQTGSENGPITGETATDPLYHVLFGEQIESFWTEELQVIPNYFEHSNRRKRIDD